MNAWLQKVGRREVERALEEAGRLGTRIHKIAEAVAWDRPIKVSPEMQPYEQALREFFAAHVRRVIGTEMSFASRELRFGGTLDLLCELHDGSIAVCDFKSTASGLTKVHGLQLAAYALLARENGHTVNKRVCVRIHKAEEKRGRWYARGYLDHKRDVEAFLAAVTLWHFLHGSKIKQAA